MTDRKPNLSYAVIAGANHEMASTITPEKELDPLYATAIAQMLHPTLASWPNGWVSFKCNKKFGELTA